ncbi:MAG: capsular polysaccharide biosynthesis protein [Campylobacterota bacterium]|nr:capsular polysaccharide biosynthesis protein [Campylobacterota bacterium]
MKQPKALYNSYYLENIISLIFYKNSPMRGWGRKKSGRFAIKCAEIFNRDFILLEDGFIRSIGLGIDDSPLFSTVEDDIGIYYDATGSSRLEEILNSYNFENDKVLMEQSKRAIALIRKYHISKYNSSPVVDFSIEEKYNLTNKNRKVLVIAQTAGDASLKFGLAEQFNIEEIIKVAIEENPAASIYLKIHPDALNSKKRSNIDMDIAKKSCVTIDDDINPISLLNYFDKVYTMTSQMGFEALLLGRECVCFGIPFYAGWGVTDDRVESLRRRRRLSVEEIFAASYILYTKYYNPYSKNGSDIFDTIDSIVKYRDRDKPIRKTAYCFGFSPWKHTYMVPFMRNMQSIKFINPLFSKTALDMAIKKGLNRESHIYIWGKKAFEDVERYAKESEIDIYRVEDGFIRSVGLGSDLTRPYSLVIDHRGIYFDPTKESDLEHILNFHSFTSDELTQAKYIKEKIIKDKLSKYNHHTSISLEIPKDRTVILIPGQVEDDASITYGAPDMSNLKLLQQVRADASEAYIIYKPHPDVAAGNRLGKIDRYEALNYCDRIVTDISIESVLLLSDEVHTMTSLVGFEAIMRGIKVYTYGTPFYAGWGLSIDKKECKRRVRRVEIDELVAATLLLYPYYIDPSSRELSDIGVTIEELKLERDRFNRSMSYQKSIKIYNLISRKLQWLLRLFREI